MWTSLLYRWKEEAFDPAPPECGPGGTNATLHRMPLCTEIFSLTTQLQDNTLISSPSGKLG